MNSIALFFETKQGKYFKNFIIGLGASVVLLGALFKIQHWPGAGIMLTVGMCTEAFIFAMLGVLPPHKDYYWERFYPNIDETHMWKLIVREQNSILLPARFLQVRLLIR